MTKFIRRQFIVSSALGAIAVALPIMSMAAESPRKLTNIIFNMLDDMGSRNLGCY